ncbi:MAG: DUF2726 domain-containing protein [Pirellulales bacterium]|nr:DUF2726 domain-containing protein [Pirellulales bacterium]
MHADEWPFRQRDDFLTPAELSFYHVLEGVVRGVAVVCPKVRLADVVFVKAQDGKLNHQNRIDRQHLDFVLCDPQTMRPRCVVELDDTSHAGKRQQERDGKKNNVLAAAGLPLVRIAAQRQYRTAELAAQLRSYLVPTPEMSSSPAAPPVLPSQRAPSVAESPVHPLCPKCGIPMIARIAQKGPHAGTEFYGCANYPQCREVRRR